MKRIAVLASVCLLAASCSSGSESDATKDSDAGRNQRLGCCATLIGIDDDPIGLDASAVADSITVTSK